MDLSFNAIASLPDEIGSLKNLEKLLITNNRLAGEVPEGFRQLISLRELDIKYNSMTSIDIISELPKLEVLYAAHNHISSFVGKFERIRQLKLNSNPLNKFEITEPAPTLKTLNLSHAQLASIDSAFAHMTNLERLVLDKNYFVSLPQQIGALSRLEHFSIANNSVGRAATSDRLPHGAASPGRSREQHFEASHGNLVGEQARDVQRLVECPRNFPQASFQTSSGSWGRNAGAAPSAEWQGFAAEHAAVQYPKLRRPDRRQEAEPSFEHSPQRRPVSRSS